jgi:hypothetical protein
VIRGLLPEDAVATAVPVVVACLVAIGILGIFMLFSTPGTSHQTSGTLAVGMPPAAQPHAAEGLGLPIPQLPPLPRHTAHPSRRGPTPPVAVTPPPSPTPSAHPTPPASGSSGGHETGIAVSYIVNSQSGSGFLGQVEVTNFGQQPVAGWQIVVALNSDVAVSFQNATGYESNGIILLHPVNGAEVVPAHGTLSVYFRMEGTQTHPITCAFNGILCGTTS